MVRRSKLDERDALVDLWRRSVLATHDFLSVEQIDQLTPLVRDKALVNLEVWVLEIDARAVGWMGLDGSNVDALFIDPDHFARGHGRRLLQFARELIGDLTLDVNEQNHAARRFYERCGCVITGRSETDSQGNPFPLLHMRLPADAPRVFE